MRHTQSTVNLQVGLPGEDGQVIKWTDLRPGRYMLAKGPIDRWDVCVARVSTEDQVRDGLSLQVQIELAIAVAGGNGHRITAAYVDPGLSAAKLSIEERPGMAALLADIKRGRIRSIYGYKRDRLSRNTPEWLSFLSTCTSHNVNILLTCPDELPVGQGAYGRFTETLVMSIAELETQLIRMRVKDSIMGRFRDGYWIGGNLPYGLFQAPDKTIQPHPQEAPIVKEIFRLAIDEMLGVMRVAQRLNDEYPLSCRGHSWTRVTVRRVLVNRKYCGYFHLTVEVEQEDGQRKRERIEQRSEALPILVSEEDWNLAAKMRADRALYRGATPSRYRASTSLLSGLFACAVCGHSLKARQVVQRHRCSNGEVHQYHHRYYFCPRGQSVRGCDYRGFANADLVEQAVTRTCSEALPGMQTAELLERAQEFAVQRRAEIQQALTHCEHDRQQSQRAVARVQEALEAATTPEEAQFYTRRIKELLGKEEELAKRIIDFQQELADQEHKTRDVKATLKAVRDWRARFAAAGQKQQRRLIAQVVERVVWHPGVRQIDVVFRFWGADGQGETSPVQFAVRGIPIPKRRQERPGVVEGRDDEH